MKIGIGKKKLMEILEKGSVAAISDDALTDTSNLSLLIKSIRITADSNLTIESGTSLMAVKYSVPVSEENGIVVKEAGQILIPAKELINWIKVQGEDSTISISLQKLQTPEIINTLEDMSDDKNIDHDKFVIRKIGVVKITSKNVSKTAGKWELDCYDPSQFASVDFKQKSEKNFELNGKRLIDTIGRVLFSSLEQDYEHILDSISIQTYNENVYFITTDMHRCAVCMIPKEDISNLKSTNPLLVPAKLLDSASKIIDPENKISFSYDNKIGRVFISQPNLNIRLACPDKENIGKFPGIDVLINKKYDALATIPKDLMNELLINAAVVNNSSALFSFSKEGLLTVKAISESDKYKPSIKQAQIKNVEKDARLIWCVSHLISGLKIIKSDEIQVSIPDNMMSVKITGKDDENFVYFTAVIKNPKYDVEVKE